MLPRPAPQKKPSNCAPHGLGDSPDNGKLTLYGHPEPAPQSVLRRPATGIEGYLPLPGPQGNLYRAVSAGAAAGGRAISAGEIQEPPRPGHAHVQRQQRREGRAAEQRRYRPEVVTFRSDAKITREGQLHPGSVRRAVNRCNGRLAQAQQCVDHRLVSVQLGVGVHLHLPDEDEGEAPWLWRPSRQRNERQITGLLPPNVRVVASNLIYIEKEGLPSGMLDRLVRIAAFQNPEFYKAQSMRLSTYGKPRVISCGEVFPEHIGLPRGCMEEVVRVFKSHHINVEVHDERTAGREINVSFHGELRSEQREAIEQVLAYDHGILCAPTAFGKTVVGAYLIAKRGVNALILVHRRQLMDQWRERLAAFLALPIGHVGQYGGGKAKRTGLIDVAVIQSLQRKGAVEDFVAEYGHVIVDECHHLSAVTFERVLREVKAKYVLGLTATPTRKDGHQPIIYMQCGPIRFHLSAKKAAESSPLEHKVFPRITDFGWSRPENETAVQDIYAALIVSQERNDLIVRDLQQALSSGRSPLVLTSRTGHLDYLAGAWVEFVRTSLL